ncbi:MAG: TraR/DksA family transcriptional regulator [Candidatus Rokuibacteriota bacterium]
MDQIRERLEKELRITATRLREISRPDELEELPASLGSIFDDVDKIQIDQTREMGLMTKGRLVQRANRLVSALKRLEVGRYGQCVECGDTIKTARLKALPEVETCLVCQDQIERMSRGAGFWDRKAA